jgi:hypothetical protein
MMPKPLVVILRGCDFFDFSQKAALKTTGLDAKKSSYRNKVTSSERSEESLRHWWPCVATSQFHPSATSGQER